MFQQLKKHVKNEKGLTLIELLAVIVILAIIAAIAIPAIGNIINNSRDKAILSEALNIMSGAKIAHMDRQCTTNKCTGTQLKDYVDGVELDDETEVNFTGSEWTIVYPELAKITPGSKYNLGGDTTSGEASYTEAVIKSKLDPDAPPPTP